MVTLWSQLRPLGFHLGAGLKETCSSREMRHPHPGQVWVMYCIGQGEGEWKGKLTQGGTGLEVQ